MWMFINGSKPHYTKNADYMREDTKMMDTGVVILKSKLPLFFICLHRILL